MTSPYPALAILGILAVSLSLAAGLIWFERRFLALFQDRYGPNRVGPFGLLQVFADMIKIFTKEDWIPPFADRGVFVLAPAIVVVTVLMSFAVLPIAPGVIVADLNIGLLFILGMSSLGVYSIVLAGWASDNKYSLLGALRATASSAASAKKHARRMPFSSRPISRWPNIIARTWFMKRQTC
jgi:NADH-quinone oxidoreductase subunit H